MSPGAHSLLCAAVEDAEKNGREKGAGRSALRQFLDTSLASCGAWRVPVHCFGAPQLDAIRAKYGLEKKD
jgi:hypothetical protein